ncbi:hypothetical protein CERSUDRAFT_113101, partial [Gelatoporia subvermispora B]
QVILLFCSDYVHGWSPHLYRIYNQTSRIAAIAAVASVPYLQQPSSPTYAPSPRAIRRPARPHISHSLRASPRIRGGAGGIRPRGQLPH